MDLRGIFKHSLPDLNGNHWKRVRNIMSPIFSLSKVKSVSHQFMFINIMYVDTVMFYYCPISLKNHVFVDGTFIISDRFELNVLRMICSLYR